MYNNANRVLYVIGDKNDLRCNVVVYIFINFLVNCIDVYAKCCQFILVFSYILMIAVLFVLHDIERWLFFLSLQWPCSLFKIGNSVKCHMDFLFLRHGNIFRTIHIVLSCFVPQYELSMTCSKNGKYYHQ